MKNIINNTSYILRKQAGKDIAKIILYWLQTKKHFHKLNICLFASINDEIDTKPLDLNLMKIGCKRFLPIIKNDNLIIKQIPNTITIKDLKTSYFNIPIPPKYSKIISVNELDIIILPGLAFDVKGNRLGRGKGYYDKLLSNVLNDNKLTKIGLSLDCQIIKEIKVSYYDKPVDLICTPLKGMQYIKTKL